jgi:hypothetical protein
VVVTSWTDAPIPWPRCRAAGTHGGGSGLLLAGDLVKAVRQESAAAVCHWWGVTPGVVWRWRKGLGVERMANDGSRRLVLAASAKGAAKLRGVPLPPDQIERRRRTACDLGLGRNLTPGYNRRHTALLWTAEEDEAVRTLPPAEAAEKTGRTAGAVYSRRCALGVSTRRG